MQFGVLGQLRVGVPGGEVSLRGQRSRDLLAVLLVRRAQSVDPHVLLDLVWREEATGLDISVVHTQIARLRRTLGTGEITTTDRGYRLADAHTDADHFVELVTRARAVPHAREAIVLLRDALGLFYADRAYADVSSDLVAAETSRLHEARIGAVELLTELLLSRHDRDSVERAVELAQELMWREPLRERGYELAMLAAWRAGRQAAALAVYDQLQRTLRVELGVDPGPSARELHARVLAQDATLSAAPARTASAARSAPAAPATRLVGREEELGRLLRLLGERRIVTVTGPGGVGKSRLLSEIHQRLEADQDTAFLDLGTIGSVDEEELLDAMGQALGLSTLDPLDLLDSLVRGVGNNELVVLVDEAERNVDALATLVGTLLRRCPRLRILVASRRPLGVVGETTFALGPLDCPPSGAGAQEAARSPAVFLLRDRLTDRAPDLVLTDADHLTLARFARRVDGLPLALELLAGYADTRSLEGLADVLDAPLELASHEVGRPARHRTLRDTILWSAERLPPEHRRVLRQLGIFMGAFDPAAAGAVVGPGCGDVDQILRSLARESLVHVERTPRGLSTRLLRTVRDLAVSGLEEHGELVQARARHRRWYAERWRGAPRSDALLLDVRDHYADFLAALRSGLEDKDGDTVGDLTLTLGRLWSYTDMLGPGLRWSGRVLDSGLLSPLDRARVLTMRATLLLHHDPATVRDELATAIPVLTHERDAIWLTTAHHLSSLERAGSGAADEALTQARLAVQTSRRTTAERQAYALSVLAWVIVDADPVASETAAQEAWELVTRSGSTSTIASVSANLARTLFALGRPEAGAELLARAAALLDPAAVPTFLRLDRAWAALLLDDVAEAAQGFARVVSANPDALEDRKGAEVYVGAACAMAAGGLPQAAELLAGAEALVERTGLTLTAWQLELLARARAQVAQLPPAPWSAGRSVVGRELAELVLEGARLAGPGSVENGVDAVGSVWP